MISACHLCLPTVTSQVNELNIIRQSLYELEIQHGKIRGHYEDEVSRLRAELLAVRQGLPANTTQPPTVGPGGIGPGPPTIPGIPQIGGTFNDPYFGRDRDRDRERERETRDRDRLLERDREREVRDRDREKDRERSTDHRDAKRVKIDRERERDRGDRDRDTRMKADRPGKQFSSGFPRSPPPH